MQNRARERADELSGTGLGHHMNKKHWINLRPGGSIPDRLVHELVLESYRLVVENLPRASGPVDAAILELRR